MMSSASTNTSSMAAKNTSHVTGLIKDGDYLFNVVKLMIAIVVTLLIICNNIINMIVLKKMRDINRRMKILLFSLSTSDFCLGIMVCIPAVASGILGYWPFTPAACQVTGTMNGVAIAVSLWSLMAISIERSVVMRKVVAIRSDKTIFPVILGVIFIWTFNITFFAFPIFLEYDYVYYKYDPEVISCSFQWKSSVYFIIAKFVYPILSGTVIVISNIRIHFILRKAQSFRKKIASTAGNYSHDASPVPGGIRSSGGANAKLKVTGQQPTLTADGAINNASHTNSKTASGSKLHPGQNVAFLVPVLENSKCALTPKNSLRPAPAQGQQQNGSQSISAGCETCTARVMTNESTQFYNIMPKSVLRRNMKSRLLLVCTSALFFLTTTPYMVSSLVDHFLVQWEMPSSMKFAALWILNTNSFINVFVYSVIYSEFRNHCRKMFNKLTCECHSFVNKIHGTRPTVKFRSESMRRTSNSVKDQSYNQDLRSSSPSGSAPYKIDMSDQQEDNRGYSYEDDTCIDSDSQRRITPVHKRDKLVLIPRNDTGVPYVLPTTTECLKVSRKLPNNRNNMPTTTNSLHINVLPSVEV